MQVESHLPFTVGKYGAKWSDKQQRWEISAPKIGRCGNRKDRGKSLALMEKLAQDDKQAAPVLAPSDAESDATVPSCRASSRSSTVVSSARPLIKPRSGAYKAGPGRSHFKKPLDPIPAALATAKS